jgi:hypothetical protein
MRFLRHDGIYLSEVSFFLVTPWGVSRFPVGPLPRYRAYRKAHALPIVRDRPAIPRSGCSPAWPVSASPTKGIIKHSLDRRPKQIKTAGCGLSGCLTLGVHRSKVQWCIVHQVRASLNYVSSKQRKAVAADLQPIYRASTAEDAFFKQEAFAEKWDGAYPAISHMWRRNWDRLTPFFAYPADIRRVIYTTNAIESLNMSLRRVIKTRGSFPSPDAALKLLFLALEHIAKKWTMPVQNWKAALQRFAIRLGDRVPQDALA